MPFMGFGMLSELHTESDVEQKLIWPLLTTAFPDGLGFSAAELLTKLNIRRLEIDKGTKRRVYFPDYIAVISGLPLLVIEAKSPSEDVLAGLDEARLYANELNAQYPSGINPCSIVVASNGTRLVCSKTDTTNLLFDLKHTDLTSANLDFANFQNHVGRLALSRAATQLRHAQPQTHFRATNFLGGQSIRNEEIGHNTFGSKLTLEYGHIFNPTTPSERAYIVNNAYISSNRKERYVEPIDRLIRGVVAPSVRPFEPLESTGKPREITKVFEEHHKQLENKLVLLIGSVGSGKSTFIDYLTEVALPDDVVERTVWLRINLNNVIPDKNQAVSWLTEQIISQLHETRQDLDFDDISTIRKLYAPELRQFTKGALALLKEGTEDYQRRLADKVIELQKDRLKTVKALTRYLCGEPGKLLVICLDNCDKRNKEEQLLTFQLAQWLQAELRCLVFLPLRDVTYDLHKNEPPLDTAIKNLTFRIEPPRFSDVLAARVRLALADLLSRAKEKTLEYVLPNGMRVEYPASDQGMYLSSIMRSLYAHDKFVRRIMSGLAGRDIRKALEIFLQFCPSGHIGEDQIFLIRTQEGEHTIPFDVVARVLLRMDRRFYDGDKSYIKNLFQCAPDDPPANHFARISILRWLEHMSKVPGPSGMTGYHPVRELLETLLRGGHAVERIRAETNYLLRERCIVSEHQSTDGQLRDDDLISLSPSGAVHLTLALVPEYLAACAEDTWLRDQPLAQVIAERIGKAREQHYSRRTTRQNAKALVDYLEQRSNEDRESLVQLTESAMQDFVGIQEIKDGMAAPRTDHSRIVVANIPFGSTPRQITDFLADRGFTATDVIALTDKGSGKFSGTMFLNVDSPTTATRVVDELDGLFFGGRQLRVDHAERPKHHAKEVSRERAVDPTRLALLNLSYSATQESLRALLLARGARFTRIDLPRGASTKGIAFVAFATAADAAAAQTVLDGTVFEGRPLRVGPAFLRGKK